MPEQLQVLLVRFRLAERDPEFADNITILQSLSKPEPFIMSPAKLRLVMGCGMGPVLRESHKTLSHSTQWDDWASWMPSPTLNCEMCYNSVTRILPEKDL